jgi:uncharacterized peroxidase-related enzyme
MSRIVTPAIESATGASAEVFAQIKKSTGKVPNLYATMGMLQPAALRAMLQADATLGAGSLSKQDVEVIKLTISSISGCTYCVAAHSLIGKFAGLSQEALKHIRHGEPTGDEKHDALIAFIKQIAQTHGELSDEAFAEIKAAGYTDEQLVEISLAIAVITFTNTFNRINDTTVDFPAVD